ncbi:hypothetical protein, partial [Paenibacillus polymyxa]
MDAKLTIAIVSSIFGISGWATFLYNHITHIPNIKGRIFSPIMGRTQIVQNGENKDLTTCLFYLYLTNKRKTAVRPLDFEMEITFTDGTSEKLQRFYGNGIYEFTFTWINNEIINPNLRENLIYKKPQAIEPKEPLHGFVLFGGSKDLYERNNREEIATYRLTVIDVFGGRHLIQESNMDQKVNLYLLSDLANFELPTTKG